MSGGPHAQRIPFLDLGRALRDLKPELQAGLDEIIDSGQVLDGPQVPGFEKDWASFCNAPHAVGVGSGTDALRLTLLALGVGPGDEVIVPAFTAIPTAAAVCATGAKPVPVDVDARTGVLDQHSAEEALTPQTRAAIVVHLYGRPAPLPDIAVPVVEDAAHAHGALPAVAGAAAVYSFYPTKNLGTIGDGGAIVTADAELAARVARLRAHGRDASGRYVEASTNSRLSEFAAMALRARLPQLPQGNRRRNEIARAYRASSPNLAWQADHEDHVHHLCVLKTGQREAFRAGLPCETALHYPRAIVDEPAYSGFERGAVPQARKWAAECVSMPCYPELGDAEVEMICNALAGFSGA